MSTTKKTLSRALIILAIQGYHHSFAEHLPTPEVITNADDNSKESKEQGKTLLSKNIKMAAFVIACACLYTLQQKTNVKKTSTLLNEMLMSAFLIFVSPHCG
jgi:hypothetical protein